MRRLFRSRREPQPAGLRIFFASDVHGSDRCWRKFLSAASVHKIDVLVMGGDITAKAVLPFVPTDGGWSVRVGDQTERLATEEERQRLEQALRDQGFYTCVLAVEDIPEEGSPEHNELYRTLARECLKRWLAIAEDKLAGTGCRLLLLPGNDDILEIDELIASSPLAENPEGSLVSLDEEHELVATGYSNPTPWETPRELPEEELQAYLERAAASVERPGNLILVAHVPPFDSGLDTAPKLTRRDGELSVVMRGGYPEPVPVGSKAVRRFIEERGPLLALHGHIHETRSVVRIGRTLCVNPGSEFTSGDISGAIIEVRDDEVVQCQLITA